jgi:hypothetical protein
MRGGGMGESSVAAVYDRRKFGTTTSTAVIDRRYRQGSKKIV